MPHIKSAFILFILLAAITGMLYPFAVTGLAQLFFSWKANGSLLLKDQKIIGSYWIGQSFQSPNLFHGRPSSISGLGPTNPLLIENINRRIAEETANKMQKIPIDMVTTSASGIDPDVSPASAYYQVDRISKNAHIPEDTLNKLIEESIHYPMLGSMGEPTINVLELNLKLLSLTKPTLKRADNHE